MNQINYRRRNISIFKKIFIIIIVTCIPVLVLAIASDDCALEKYITIRTGKGEFYFFDIELAITPKQKMTGLINRTELKDRTGMLFLFNNEVGRNFWMKGTLIPLDIIFITGNGTISYIHQMAQPMDTTMIYSFGPAKAVLEINGGESVILDINVGDKVQHTVFGNTPFQCLPDTGN